MAILAAAGSAIAGGVGERPMPRPVVEVASQAPPLRPAPSREAIATDGPLCGDATLAGAMLDPIVADGGCGVAEPVRLSSADGVALDPPATIDCATARALSVWLRRGPVATFARKGAAVGGLVVVDAYSCRNRNRAGDGKLSEHSFGRAIDVAAFALRDGRTVTVLEGWRSPDWSAALQRIHASGCGAFATVLGPEANALHADHLHLDMAARRSGPYCE